MAFQWVLLLLRASGILPCSKLVVLATLYKCFQNKSLVPRLFASWRLWRTIPTEGLLRDYSKMEPYEGLFQIEASFGNIPECGLIWDYSRMGPHERLLKNYALLGAIPIQSLVMGTIPKQGGLQTFFCLRPDVIPCREIFALSRGFLIFGDFSARPSILHL